MWTCPLVSGKGKCKFIRVEGKFINDQILSWRARGAGICLLWRDDETNLGTTLCRTFEKLSVGGKLFVSNQKSFCQDVYDMSNVKIAFN